jgi:hypothetical protein
MPVNKLFYSKALFLLLLVSCNYKVGVEFYVKNERDTVLHKINLFPSSGSLVIYNLKPGETTNIFMDFKGHPKVDGGYGIVIDNSTHKNNNLFFGYYSNGIPNEKEIRITIQNDTFKVISDFRDGY